MDEEIKLLRIEVRFYKNKVVVLSVCLLVESIVLLLNIFD